MKEKRLRIILDVLIIIIGIVFLFFGIKDGIKEFDKYKVSDAEKFHKSYNYVSVKESVYEYVSLRKATKLLDENSVILVGKTTNAWTQVLVKPLNDIYKDSKIYYVELDDIENTSPAYHQFLSKLKLKKMDIPTVIVTKEGKHKIISRDDIVDKDYEGAPIDYFNKETKNKLKELLD